MSKNSFKSTSAWYALLTLQCCCMSRESQVCIFPHGMHWMPFPATAKHIHRLHGESMKFYHLHHLSNNYSCGSFSPSSFSVDESTLALIYLWVNATNSDPIIMLSCQTICETWQLSQNTVSHLRVPKEMLFHFCHSVLHLQNVISSCHCLWLPGTQNNSNPISSFI